MRALSHFYERVKKVMGLSWALARARFILRNEGTWLGILWYLLSPVLTFLLLLKIFMDRLGQDIPQYPLYLLLGIILFNFANKVATESIAIFRLNAGMIKSFNFSRESFVISVVLATLLSHLFEIAVLIFLLLFYGVSVKMMIFYPVIILCLTLFVLGLSFLLASLGMYFYDLDHIWGFFSKLVWLATPIFYSIGGQERLGILNLFNPLYYFITIARDVIIYVRMPEMWLLLGAFFYTVIFLVVGISVFYKLERKFAELI